MSLAGALANRAASKQASVLLAPLLPDEESTDSDYSEDESEGDEKMETVKHTPLQKLKTSAVYVLLAGGVVVSAAAMVLSPVVLVFVSGGICCANVPYAIYKEWQMAKIPTLRSMNNALREDANRLEDEVDVLSDEIDNLAPEADRARAVEEELRSIADKQQVNVNKLVDLVKENDAILVQMRTNLRQRIVQDVIKIVVSSDKDNDQSIDRSEAKTLALKIRLQLQEYAVEFDSEKFFKVVEANPTVNGVINIVQKLMPKEDREGEEDDESTSDDEDDIHDMFYIVDDKGDTGELNKESSGLRRTSLMMTKNESRRMSAGADDDSSSSPVGGRMSRKSLLAKNDRRSKRVSFTTR
eukprot:scaffold3159_cov191-Alexandrium_tamarense.AAC.5